MITLSEPIVTSSPIATPSWMRTCARRSHERPTIAPSTVVERPIEVDASMIERDVRARSRSVTLEPRTVYGPTVASGATRQ